MAATAGTAADSVASVTPVIAAPAVTRVTPVAPPSSPLVVSLISITPTIAVPKSPVTIIGRVRNTGPLPIAAPVALALVGDRPLPSRAAVAGWAASSGEEAVGEVARTSLGKGLAPDSFATFVLTIAPTAVSHRGAFAVLPLRLDVVGTTPGAAPGLAAIREHGYLHTFLPTLAAIKAFEPLSIGWLVPLTLDPDPALHGTDSPARTAAWIKAIGPGSRLDGLVQGTQDSDATWAIDPAILGPRQPPTAADNARASGQTPGGPTPGASTPGGSTPSDSTSPSPGGPTNPDPVAEPTTALAGRLRTAAPRHTLWSLPYADPDLAALLPSHSTNPILTSLISRSSLLDGAVGPARTDIAWPVTGTLTTQNEARIRRAYAAPGLSAVVTSAATLPDLNGSTADASRRSGRGLPVLAYDPALSRTLAQTSSKSAGAVTVQQFLADSMALLGERPGTPNRSVLVAAPRAFAGDPTVLKSLFAAVANTPWLVPTTTDQLIAESMKLVPEALNVAPTQSTGSPTASATTSDPLNPGTSELTSAQLDTIPRTLSAITGIAGILVDSTLFRQRWTDAQDQLLSTRWRNRPDGRIALDAATTTAIQNVSRGVSVSPSSVNFFADRGVLQVTVVNNLRVAIHDVHLTLTPAQPRLRIEQQPGPLKIGARSRTNIPLQVTSIAAGLVRIEAALTTGNGTPLGQNARVDVRVQPTSTWIYWVLGGLAGVVLMLGTYRSVRRGSTRAAHPGAPESPLDD